MTNLIPGLLRHCGGQIKKFKHYLFATLVKNKANKKILPKLEWCMAWTRLPNNWILVLKWYSALSHCPIFPKILAATKWIDGACGNSLRATGIVSRALDVWPKINK